MNIEFKITAAKAAYDSAEKAVNSGTGNGVAQYKAAAKYYREIASVVTDKKDEYIKLAEECEAKASGKFNAPQQNNSSSNKNTPSNNTNKNNNTINSNNSNINNFRTNTPQQQGEQKQPEPVEQLTVEEALKRLNDLVGLAGVKKKVVQWVALVKSFKEREANGLPVPEGFSYHLVFTGNPGTGKTTVARIMAQIYRSLGILENGQLVETARNDLVAGYVGQTAIKTQEAIDKALGGVLFVDEAYALVKKGSGTDFGQEAIDTILKNMEDHRNELVVIMAGYSGPMAELLKTNEGLTSRFSNIVEFEDYSAEELFKIFKGLCDKNSYIMDASVAEIIKSEFAKLYETRNEHFGNARTVRNIFQKVVEKQALRIQTLTSRTKEDMMSIKVEDLPDFKTVR